MAIWYLVKIPSVSDKAKNIKLVVKLSLDSSTNKLNNIKLKKKKVASKSVWVVVAWKSIIGKLSNANNNNSWPWKLIFNTLKIMVPKQSININDANWIKLEKASVPAKIWKLTIIYSDKGEVNTCLTILVG